MACLCADSAADLWWQDVGSTDGCGPRFGARSAGFRGRFASGRWRWMSGAEAAEAGFHCRGKRGMVVVVDPLPAGGQREVLGVKQIAHTSVICGGY